MNLIVSLCLGLCFFSMSAAYGKTLDFKPLSVEVKPEDRYLVRGFKGKISISAQKSDRLTVTLKQVQPSQISSDMKEVVDEWLFSVQKRENIIEVLVRSPHSKASWEKTLQNQVMPSFEMQISGPPKALDLALRDGTLKIDNWSAPLKIYAQKGSVTINGGEGELTLGIQEGQVNLNARKGSTSIDSYAAKISSRSGEGGLRVVNFSGNTNIEAHQGAVDLNGYQGEFDVSKGRGRVDFDVDRSTVKINGRSGDIRGQSGQGALIATTSGQAEVRVTTKEGNVSLNMAGSGAQVNIGTEEGQIYAPNYLRLSRLPTMKLMQGRLRGKESGQVYVRSESGSIRLR